MVVGVLAKRPPFVEKRNRNDSVTQIDRAGPARAVHRFTAALRRPSGTNHCAWQQSYVGQESAPLIPQNCPTTAWDVDRYVAWKPDFDASLYDQLDAESIQIDISV